MNTNDISLIETRIALLEDYRVALKKYFHGEYDVSKDDLKSYINKNLVAVKNAVYEAGTLKMLSIGPPPMIGGARHSINPFDNIFEDFWGRSVIPDIVDSIEQAIGVYEHLKNKTGLINLNHKEAIDIESAVERALRPAFRNEPPTNEKDVQDAVEDILNALGIKFTRDREVAPIGPKAFKPDFIIKDLDLAIEVKLARESHPATAIQDELNADISAYRTKWKRLLVIVYDLGVIDDPYKMRKDNMQYFGVSVIIIKH
jgi:hypothetical protein